MTEYTQLNTMERRILLTEIGDLCHASDEFFKNLKALISTYKTNNDGTT